MALRFSEGFDHYYYDHLWDNWWTWDKTTVRGKQYVFDNVVKVEEFESRRWRSYQVEFPPCEN